jgi:hypothetical protein
VNPREPESPTWRRSERRESPPSRIWLPPKRDSRR